MPDNEMIIWLRDNILDITPTVGLGNGRGGEIQKWLNEHPDVDNYVILDDDGDMWDSQLYHFVQMNYENGICAYALQRRQNRRISETCELFTRERHRNLADWVL